jgi:hypothetical protein
MFTGAGGETMLLFVEGLLVGSGATIVAYHYGVIRKVREELDALRHDFELLRDRVKISKLI